MLAGRVIFSPKGHCDFDLVAGPVGVVIPRVRGYGDGRNSRGNRIHYEVCAAINS